MANNIRLKRTGTSGKKPTSEMLDVGEVALNMADSIMWFRADDNADGSAVIKELSTTQVPDTPSFQEYRFVASELQTSFGGDDANGNELEFTSDNVLIFKNSIIISRNVDYQHNEYSLELVDECEKGDEIRIIVFANYIEPTISTLTNGVYNATGKLKLYNSDGTIIQTSIPIVDSAEYSNTTGVLKLNRRGAEALEVEIGTGVKSATTDPINNDLVITYDDGSEHRTTIPKNDGFDIVGINRISFDSEVGLFSIVLTNGVIHESSLVIDQPDGFENIERQLDKVIITSTKGNEYEIPVFDGEIINNIERIENTLIVSTNRNPQGYTFPVQDGETISNMERIGDEVITTTNMGQTFTYPIQDGELLETFEQTRVDSLTQELKFTTSKGKEYKFNINDGIPGGLQGEIGLTGDGIGSFNPKKNAKGEVTYVEMTTTGVTDADGNVISEPITTNIPVVKGEQGVGKQGEQGIQGIQGIQGEQGIQGRTGLTGEQGVPGDAGEAVKGNTGDSIYSMYRDDTTGVVTVRTTGTFDIATNEQITAPQVFTYANNDGTADHIESISRNKDTGLVTILTTSYDSEVAQQIEFQNSTLPPADQIEIPGKFEIEIPSGKNGRNGIKGDKGQKGDSGDAGEAIKGDKGDTGFNGVTGRSIVGFRSDPENQRIVGLYQEYRLNANGESITSGEIEEEAFPFEYNSVDSEALLPSQDYKHGKYLQTDGTQASWEDIEKELPEQGGHLGKFLSTDGVTTEWQDVESVVADTVSVVIGDTSSDTSSSNLFNVNKVLQAGRSYNIQLPKAHNGSTTAHIKQYLPGDFTTYNGWDFELNGEMFNYDTNKVQFNKGQMKLAGAETGASIKCMSMGDSGGMVVLDDNTVMVSGSNRATGATCKELGTSWVGLTHMPAGEWVEARLNDGTLFPPIKDVWIEYSSSWILLEDGRLLHGGKPYDINVGIANHDGTGGSVSSDFVYVDESTVISDTAFRDDDGNFLTFKNVVPHRSGSYGNLHGRLIETEDGQWWVSGYFQPIIGDPSKTSTFVYTGFKKCEWIAKNHVKKWAFGHTDGGYIDNDDVFWASGTRGLYMFGLATDTGFKEVMRDVKSVVYSYTYNRGCLMLLNNQDLMLGGAGGYGWNLTISASPWNSFYNQPPRKVSDGITSLFSGFSNKGNPRDAYGDTFYTTKEATGEEMYVHGYISNQGFGMPQSGGTYTNYPEGYNTGLTGIRDSYWSTSGYHKLLRLWNGNVMVSGTIPTSSTRAPHAFKTGLSKEYLFIYPNEQLSTYVFDANFLMGSANTKESLDTSAWGTLNGLEIDMIPLPGTSVAVELSSDGGNTWTSSIAKDELHSYPWQEFVTTNTLDLRITIGTISDTINPIIKGIKILGQLKGNYVQASIDPDAFLYAERFDVPDQIILQNNKTADHIVKLSVEFN